jgi:ATP-dependent Lon protease
MNEVDERIHWLATVICRPTWRDAARAVCERAKATAGFDAAELLQRAGTVLIDDRNDRLRGFAGRVRAKDPVLCLAFELIALSTDDAAATMHIVAGAIGLLCSADGDTREARARLRVWDDVVRAKHTGDDFFEIADRFWEGEMKFIVASKGDRPVRDRFSHPALQTLMHSRWDDAFGYLHHATNATIGEAFAQALLDALQDRAAMRTAIAILIDQLHAIGTPSAGALALAWRC